MPVTCGTSHREVSRRTGCPGLSWRTYGRSVMEILIVGGGYIGMYTARRLERLLRRGEATVTVVDPRGYMTYQPFLAEAAGGSVEPRHVIAPLPRVLRRTRVLTGKIVSIDRAAHQAVFAPAQS